MSERTEATAVLDDAVAAEPERAAAHARTAARQFRDENVPRGAANAWAAQGHVRKAQDSVDARAKDHADRSSS